MEMIRKARKFEMIDETGIVREFTITLEHELGIMLDVTVPEYIDENGNFKKFIGQFVPQDTTHRRVDISRSKGRSAENDERCSQTDKAGI